MRSGGLNRSHIISSEAQAFDTERYPVNKQTPLLSGHGRRILGGHFGEPLRGKDHSDRHHLLHHGCHRGPHFRLRRRDLRYAQIHTYKPDPVLFLLSLFESITNYTVVFFDSQVVIRS